jgi:hypothetical protein
VPFFETDSLSYFAFDSLAGENLIQACLTRHGGVSQAPWATLNLGGTVGDDPGHVQENRRRAFQALGASLEHMYDVWQVHSAEVVLTDRPRPAEQVHLQADAILTDRPGLALFMRFADCVPIFLYDPIHRAIGLVHAGWIGTVKQIAGRAVLAMQDAFHSNPGDLLGAIGPSIGPHHYPVGADVAEQVRHSFGADANALLTPIDGNDDRVQLDLWWANRLVLEHAGVRRVEMAGICTACHLEDWYSHRGEGGKTGRFGAILQLKG